MSDPNPADTPAWTVVGQLPMSDTDDNGTFGPGVRITFKTASGVEDKIFVTRADYTPDRVRELISSLVAAHDAIANLTG